MTIASNALSKSNYLIHSTQASYLELPSNKSTMSSPHTEEEREEKRPNIRPWCKTGYMD